MLLLLEFYLVFEKLGPTLSGECGSDPEVSLELLEEDQDMEALKMLHLK